MFSDCESTAAAAVEKLGEFPYTVVIVDAGLPGGVEHVIARISQLPRIGRPIVLVLAPTAEAGRSLDVDIVQIVLRRPVEISQVVDLVRSCMRSVGDEKRQDLAGGEGRQGHVRS